MPGAEQAVKHSKSGKIGIIGTEGTINSQAYPKEIKRLLPDAETYSIPCPLFVPLVEEGWNDHPVAMKVAEEYLSPLIAKSIDTLVLGCTHYPILKPVIQKAVGDNIMLIDSAEAVTEFLTRYFKDNQHPDAKSNQGEEYQIPGKDFFYVSDNEEKFRIIASRILQREITNLIRVKLAESWFI